MEESAKLLKFISDLESDISKGEVDCDENVGCTNLASGKYSGTCALQHCTNLSNEVDKVSINHCSISIELSLRYFQIMQEVIDSNVGLYKLKSDVYRLVHRQAEINNVNTEKLTILLSVSRQIRNIFYHTLKVLYGKDLLYIQLHWPNLFSVFQNELLELKDQDKCLYEIDSLIIHKLFTKKK